MGSSGSSDSSTITFDVLLPSSPDPGALTRDVDRSGGDERGSRQSAAGGEVGPQALCNTLMEEPAEVIARRCSAPRCALGAALASNRVRPPVNLVASSVAGPRERIRLGRSRSRPDP